MRNLFFVMILAFAFGCGKDDEPKHRDLDARFVDVEVATEDGGVSDGGDLDEELPVADGILPPLDMELPVVDAEVVVDAELPLVDAEVVESDLALVPLDGSVAPDDAGSTDAVDAALSDM